jgi:hypothetical protein
MDRSAQPGDAVDSASVSAAAGSLYRQVHYKDRLMDERLSNFLAQAYRRDVLGESLEVEMPDLDPDVIDREIAAIDALKLGAHLASRDFVSYQNRRVLVALRDRLKAAKKPVPAEDLGDAAG